jgi:hypothetical protein
VLLLGGLIFLAGVSRPVVGDWADAFDDEAKRIAIAKADADQFTVGICPDGCRLHRDGDRARSVGQGDPP